MENVSEILRIRFHTWYWGKWVYSGAFINGSHVTETTPGFEIYDEAKHGLHNEVQ